MESRATHLPKKSRSGGLPISSANNVQPDDIYFTRSNKTDAHTNREHSDHVIISDVQSRSFSSLQRATDASRSPYSWPKLLDASDL